MIMIPTQIPNTYSVYKYPMVYIYIYIYISHDYINMIKVLFDISPYIVVA